MEFADARLRSFVPGPLLVAQPPTNVEKNRLKAQLLTRTNLNSITRTRQSCDTSTSTLTRSPPSTESKAVSGSGNCKTSPIHLPVSNGLNVTPPRLVRLILSHPTFSGSSRITVFGSWSPLPPAKNFRCAMCINICVPKRGVLSLFQNNVTNLDAALFVFRNLNGESRLDLLLSCCTARLTKTVLANVASPCRR
eukprot:9481641-Pyramimonas_sp.AAC.2